MGTITDTRLIAAEQAAGMGDIGPYELVRGRIIAMTPTGDEHAELESTLDVWIGSYVRAHKLGKVYVGEVGIVTQRNPDTVRGADLAFVSREHVRPRSGKYLAVAPDLAVEIMSSGDTWAEALEKVQEYLLAGVRLVWVVLPKTRQVYVYRSMADLHVFGEGDTLQGDDVLPGFALPVGDIFAE